VDNDRIRLHHWFGSMLWISVTASALLDRRQEENSHRLVVCASLNESVEACQGVFLLVLDASVNRKYKIFDQV